MASHRYLGSILGLDVQRYVFMMKGFEMPCWGHHYAAVIREECNRFQVNICRLGF